MPPSFDWSKSTNLDSAQVLYPAPKRLTDKAGDTDRLQGHGAVSRAAQTRRTPPSRSTVHLAFDYGVCKDICIPAEAELALTVAPRTQEAVAEELVGCHGARCRRRPRRDAKPIPC